MVPWFPSYTIIIKFHCQYIYIYINGIVKYVIYIYLNGCYNGILFITTSYGLISIYIYINNPLLYITVVIIVILLSVLLSHYSTSLYPMILLSLLLLYFTTYDVCWCMSITHWHDFPSLTHVYMRIDFTNIIECF